MTAHKKFGFGMRALGMMAGVLMLAACGNGKSGDGAAKTDGFPPAAKTQIEVPADVAKSGTWGDVVYGDANAPVEIIEYASITCPHCAQFYRDEFPELKKEFIDTGKVKFIFRNFLLNRLDLAASTVARCGDMDTTKKLMQILYERQAQWEGSKTPEDELAAIARRVGISRTEFDRCLENTKMHEHLTKMSTIAQKQYQVKGTPTLFVNGIRIEGHGMDAIKKAIADAK
ncbi:DsbA family protein [Kordiimonas marina]|uniref:DsbA family protein n=1 Tax=Kordiimonas marina TaxID=2872312 RepID=UPI001FF0E6FF|nr:DsbA family protein [Kordiimonas marina]MCJ9429402.1 DsbA family protein [Kordiimonas marina]